MLLNLPPTVQSSGGLECFPVPTAAVAATNLLLGQDFSMENGGPAGQDSAVVPDSFPREKIDKNLISKGDN